MSETYEQPHALQDVPNETTATNLQAGSELAPPICSAASMAESIAYRLAKLPNFPNREPVYAEIIESELLTWQAQIVAATRRKLHRPPNDQS